MLEVGVQSSMDLHKLLEVGKASVQRVRGVRNAQLRVALICKQEGQMSAQTPIGSPQFSVRIMPSADDRIDRAFSQEPAPFLMP